MINLRDGVLPDQFFFRDFRPKIARAWTHVAVGQLEPGTGEGIREFVRVFEEAPRDRFVDRVHF